jgi:hypothetical protein
MMGRDVRRARSMPRLVALLAPTHAALANLS